jgi:excisionase family DNA binding protein
VAGGAPERASRGRLFSPEEAAAYLNVHVQTVRAWIRSGKLPASRLAGLKSIRIREADLEKVLEPIEPTETRDT